MNIQPHFDSDVIPNLDKLLVHRSASLDCRGEGQSPTSSLSAAMLSALAQISSANVTPALPVEQAFILQNSSPDSADRAVLILDAPEAANFRYQSSRIRRRSVSQREFHPTPEDMELDQYDLNLTDDNCESPLPLIHLGGSEKNPGHNWASKNTPKYATQTLRLPWRSAEDAVRCYEDYASAVSNSPDLGNDMVYTLLSSPYER